MACRNPTAFLSAALLMCMRMAACDAADASNVPTAVIKSTLQSRFPNVTILEVNPTPMPHLYEIYTGDGIAYSDEKGEYLLSGSLTSTSTKRNLTSESLDAHYPIDFKTLPLDHAIKIVKGSGRRQLAVFSDPDCPYCQRLEKELSSLSDVTIYLFLYPLTGVHPQAADKARLIWCAPDRGKAWTQWMLDRKAPEGGGAACTDTPVEANEKLGEQLRINSTPVLFTANGHRISGVRQAAQLEELLNQATP